jgi:hypothetical protein
MDLTPAAEKLKLLTGNNDRGEGVSRWTSNW